jgi:hypothetical protein
LIGSILVAANGGIELQKLQVIMPHNYPTIGVQHTMKRMVQNE